MQYFSGHVIFRGKFNYASLSPHIRRIIELFLEFSGQKAMVQREGRLDLLVYMNRRDLMKGRKPEGVNRENAKMRLLFPLHRKEIALISDVPNPKVRDATNAIVEYLKSKGFNVEVRWNDLTLLRRTGKVK